MRIPRHVYMVGIGGIGMSALAQFLQHTGHVVEGADRDESPVTTLLGEKGIKVWIGHDSCNMPAATQLLIYSDAVPHINRERLRAKELKISEMSYFEALGAVTSEGRTIAVKARAGAEGRLFGSITSVDIAEAVLKQTGAEVDRRKIELTEPLKELGGVDLSVRLHPDVVANLHVEVEAAG